MDRHTHVTGVTEVQAGRGPARDTILLGKYRVDSTLGVGGMALVIKAHNMALDEFVAIKLLREDVQLDHGTIERFVREAKNAVRLKSEHVARIRDVGLFEDGRPYIVMELLEGYDLGQTLQQVGRLDRRRAVDLVLQACDAIAEAHALGIVHRDLKPTNLFLTRRRDGTELLKVLDFGISKVRGGPDMSLTQTSSVLGTPAYMSPEQMRSARVVDPRSDIWSLGTLLYEVVEGRLPFDASSFAELCVMVATETYAPMTLARELAPVIDRCLAKHVEHRYQDVAELALALQPYASEAERARRQVRRIYRVLGREHPELELSLTPVPRADSTPTSNPHRASPPTSNPHRASPPPSAEHWTPPPDAQHRAPPSSAEHWTPPPNAQHRAPPSSAEHWAAPRMQHREPPSSAEHRAPPPSAPYPAAPAGTLASSPYPAAPAGTLASSGARRPWGFIAAVLAIFAIGATIGIVAMTGNQTAASLDAATTNEHVMTVEYPDATPLDAAPPDAEIDSGAALDAGTRAQITPPIKRIKKPKPKPPVAPLPPKPKCDPFDNPNGCPPARR